MPKPPTIATTKTTAGYRIGCLAILACVGLVMLGAELFLERSGLSSIRVSVQQSWLVEKNPTTTASGNADIDPAIASSFSAAVPPICTDGIAPGGSLTVDSLCHCVPFWTRGKSPSAVTSLWNSDYMMEKIHQAAYKSFKACWHWPNALKDSDEIIFANLTQHMLNSLTSHRLKRSIKSRTSPFVMERLLEVVLRRLQDPDHNPPLQIAVFGGSVTAGHRSRANSIHLPTNIKGQDVCAWTGKLEVLLNQLLQPLAPLYSNDNSTTDQPKIAEVHNFAVDGTDSSIGVTLLEYDLFGTDMSKMDVFISAFGANDLQAPEGLDRDRIYVHMQRYMRIAKSQRPCSDLPLVIQLDDVFADSLRPSVREGLRYFREMVETNNWADFMSVSYADAVRDLVYANTSDTTLTEFGELHPGMTFHMGIPWILAYNLLEGFLNGACDASTLPQHQNAEPRNGFPLPVLHDQLIAQDVPQLWKDQSMAMSQLCSQHHNNVTGTRCEFQYIAHRLGAKTKEAIQELISAKATHMDGWEATGYPIRKPRRTWKAMKQYATFTIQLDNISMPINRLLVLYLKSYGIDWESTRLEIVVEGRAKGEADWTELNRLELTGVHNSRTSISYSEHVELGTFLTPRSSVRATFTVVGGAQFQINGLALCHSPQPVETIK